MIYEIRNYHYEPSLLEEYRAWAKETHGGKPVTENKAAAAATGPPPE